MHRCDPLKLMYLSCSDLRLFTELRRDGERKGLLYYLLFIV
jgi:hypothetical protein